MVGTLTTPKKRVNVAKRVIKAPAAPPVPTVEFEELHEYGGHHEYFIPNETTKSWRELCAQYPVDKAVGICSAGEVGLFGMLPSVRTELTLVDHSLRSLRVAMMKYLLLKAVGDKAYDLVIDKDKHAEFLAETDKAFALLPDTVKIATGAYNRNSTNPFTGHRTDLAYEWKRCTSLDVVKQVVPALDKVKFVHGDTSDLIERGPYDMVYISNAHQHTPRQGARSFLEGIEALVPGGYVLVADGARYASTESKAGLQKFLGRGWEFKAAHTLEQTGTWDQHVYKVPVPSA